MQRRSCHFLAARPIASLGPARFAADSPLEEDGFEPSVPPAKKDPPRRDIRPFQHFPSEKDRGFESVFLQRRVRNEPSQAEAGRSTAEQRWQSSMIAHPTNIDKTMRTVAGFPTPSEASAGPGQ